MVVVAVYCLPSGDWSFTPQPQQKPIFIQAPPGSALRDSKLFGRELFVPSETDPLQLVGWSARRVVVAMGRGDSRFGLRASGPLATRCAG